MNYNNYASEFVSGVLMIRRISQIISRVHLTSTQAPGNSHSKVESLKKNLEKLGNAVHRYGISMTGMLPFSSRGVIFNLVRAPIFIPLRLIQSIGPDFSQKMKAALDKDWNQGIKDFYTDLMAPENKDKKREVHTNFHRYADHVYVKKDEMIQGSVFLSPGVEMASLNQGYQLTITLVMNELQKLGFEVDSDGNFYDTKTGTMFNLVLDRQKEPHEIIVSFMGLGNEENLSIEQGIKDQLSKEGKKAAGADWFGGIPPSARQAIEIGRVLKDLTANSPLVPVMVGHSHGGALAQTGAVANGIKGVAFNSRPMGAGVRRFIGQSKIAENAGKITVFSGKGDWLSANRAINLLSVLFERLTGIPVPRSIGTGYNLPRVEDDDIHNAFEKAMAELQYDQD